MKKLPLFLLLLGGCIEYEPSSTLPPAGVPNARPLAAETQEDRLLQVNTPAVDILWVVDNSSSMLDEQQTLVSDFPFFMNYFLNSGLDYHIGVTSTDVVNSGPGLSGQLREFGGAKWIDPDTPNPIQAFTAMASLGINGNGNESGRDGAYVALEVRGAPGALNEGFERSHASLHLIMVSDEEDRSDITSVDEYIQWLLTRKSSPDEVTSSSFIWEPGCPVSNTESEGLDYKAVTNAVGGVIALICTDDWEGPMNELGLQASGATREYFLSEIPVPGTIRVYVKDGELVQEFEEEIDYAYNPTRNSIVFHEFVPDALAEVMVQYEVLGAGEG